jgi:hypothetical protein
VRVRWGGAAPPRGLAPLVVVIGPQSEEIVLIATRGADLVLRRWRRSAHWLLEQPELTWPGGLEGRDIRGLLEVSAVSAGLGAMFELGNERHAAGLGPGRGWALIAPDRWVDPALRPALDALWLAILCFPVGLWLPQRWRGPALAAAALGCLWLAPMRLGLSETSSAEWAGALAGLIAGRLVQGLASRLPTRAAG